AGAFISGPPREAVAPVRRGARKKPQDVVRPKPHHPVILVERDPDDTRLADEHLKRGWPAYLEGPDENGNRTEFDYMVMGEDGDPVEVGVTTTELANKRGTKSAGMS